MDKLHSQDKRTKLMKGQTLPLTHAKSHFQMGKSQGAPSEGVKFEQSGSPEKESSPDRRAKFNRSGTKAFPNNKTEESPDARSKSPNKRKTVV